MDLVAIEAQLSKQEKEEALRQIQEEEAILDRPSQEEIPVPAESNAQPSDEPVIKPENLDNLTVKKEGDFVDDKTMNTESAKEE